jgi:hypothetical protein
MLLVFLSNLQYLWQVKGCELHQPQRTHMSDSLDVVLATQNLVHVNVPDLAQPNCYWNDVAVRGTLSQWPILSAAKGL